ncbi:MAG: hypothetical protein HUJ26_00365 [Planctomycetaceae bacterium]|nr:hypothetical protein [Planctomycetaceae bacterium]
MAWKHFHDWLVAQNNELESLLRLWEVSGEFPRGELNALMNAQVEKLIARTDAPETKKELQQAQEMDWIGYVDAAARRLGVKEHDLDNVVHDIIVRLLVSPGTLFSGWSGQPIMARFKLSVRNALLNHRAARMTRRKRIPAVSMHGGGEAAMDVPVRQSQSETLIQAFREFLLEKHGQAALDVFDERLAGGETKSLIGQPGLETSYKIKKVVQAIKRTAEEFGASDPEFLALVRRAMEEEAETVGKRFGVKMSQKEFRINDN